MTKYYDCIGKEVCVGDSVVYSDDELELHIGEIVEIDDVHITPTFVICYNKDYYVRRFKSEICYITTLNELGE